MTYDTYAVAIEPKPEPQAKCPRCRRQSVEYDRKEQTWRCWACVWRDRK